VRNDVTSDRQQAKSGGLSVTTLIIASASSLAAAIVVSKLWGGGTLIGAAMTPVIVALVSEGLHRPATVVATVRDTRSGRFDPVAEGRAGLREGDLENARSSMPAAAVAERRVHRASGGVAGRRGGGLRLRLPRPRLIAAVVTGLAAFVLAGVLLTGSELVLGKSVVSSSQRTTYIPVPRDTTTTKTTSTTSTTPTTTTPTTTTPTQSEPPATSTTPTVPATQTAPTPTTTTPPPAQAPGAAPATPAPQSATPPASTTP
jgi:hypothetical protein